jgi:uncharacterized coiled-coil DUF342 family protein
MPKIGDPVGDTYTVAQKYPDSPRLRAALAPASRNRAYNVSYDTHEKRTDGGGILQSDWYIVNQGERETQKFLYTHSKIQRRIKDQEELDRVLTENASSEPVVQYTMHEMVPKLSALHQHLDHVSNEQAKSSKAQVDDLSKTLERISMKAGNADDRLDLVEQKVIAMDEKIDTIQKDVSEIKNMVLAIRAALNPRRNN